MCNWPASTKMRKFGSLISSAKSVKLRGAAFMHARIAQYYQTLVDVLGQDMLFHGVKRQPARHIAFPHRSAAAQLITCVVSTLSMRSSWQKPSSSALIPAESTSVNSVRLPTPIIIGMFG